MQSRKNDILIAIVLVCMYVCNISSRLTTVLIVIVIISIIFQSFEGRFRYYRERGEKGFMLQQKLSQSWFEWWFTNDCDANDGL